VRRPDKEEVIGQAGEKNVLFLKQLIEVGKYRNAMGFRANGANGGPGS